MNHRILVGLLINRLLYSLEVSGYTSGRSIARDSLARLFYLLECFRLDILNLKSIQRRNNKR